MVGSGRHWDWKGWTETSFVSTRVDGDPLDHKTNTVEEYGWEDTRRG